MLQFMVRDLELAAIQSSYPSATNSANLQFVANLPTNPSNNTTIPADLLNPHAAFWQAPVANDKTRGDLAEVGYFVRWDTSQADVAKATLCRFFAQPGSTNYLIYDSVGGAAVNWLAPGTIGSVAPATKSKNFKGWFADNVIALWIRCLDSNGDPILANSQGTSFGNGYGFDSRQGYRYTNTATTVVTKRVPALPTAVDIALVTVDPRTAAKITPTVAASIQALYASINTPDNFGRDKSVPGSVAFFMDKLPEQIKSGAQVFTTRAYLNNSSK